MLGSYKKGMVGLLTCVTIAGSVLPSAGFAAGGGTGAKKSSSSSTSKSSGKSSSSSTSSTGSTKKSSGSTDRWADKKIAGGRWARA